MDERFDAQAELQNSHIDRSSLIPPGHLKPLIDFMVNSYEDQALAKSASTVVPFPSKNAGKKGVQSVVVDDLNYAITGEYVERPGAMNFSVLRGMVEQTPVLSAVVMTRVRQVQAFCKVQESGFGPGFVIRHADKAHKLTDEERKTTELLQRFFLNTGWEFNPRQRKRLGRQSLRQFIALSVRDSLAMDSAPIETEMKRNKALGIDGFYAVDGATIRLCTDEGYRENDEIFALQVVQGNVRTAYDYNGLIYEPRNPRTDVMASGYGMSETELLIKVVTGFLNAMTLNIRGFSDNSIPKGVLHLSGNYSESDLASFKRFWNGMVKGVNNAWSVPVLVSKDQESKASFENFGVEFNEMMFSKWMTFLTSIICAIYGMSPAEINFDSFSGGNTSPLGGSDTAEKLAASKDSGLRPLLAYYENIFSDYILAEMGDSYVFRWTGVDEDDQDKRHELKKLVMNVNEMRAELGLEAQSASWGEAPLNPSLIGPWSQEQQAAQQPGPDMQSAEQAPGFGGGQGGPDDGQDDQKDQVDQQEGEGQEAGGKSPPPGRGDGQDQDDAGEQPMRKANDTHDGLGRFASAFAPKRSGSERRGKTFSRSALLKEHIDGLSQATAELLMVVKSVKLPVLRGDDRTQRENALKAAKKTASYMRDNGLAIKNHGSSALIELSTGGLKHAKAHTGDLRAARLMTCLPLALSRAVYFKSEIPDPRKHGTDIVAYHKFAVPVDDGGSLVLAVLHVEEDARGHFYYDGSVTPEIDRLDGISGAGAGGVDAASRNSDRRQAYVDHIKSLLESKPGLGEIHTFFRKSLERFIANDALLKALQEDADPPKPHPDSHGVGVHDEVFFHHPQHGATSGKVLAYGADGFTAEHSSGRVGVPWESFLGHKKRADRTLTHVESGEGGSIVKDELTGRHHFLAGNPAEFDGEDHEFDEERSLILGDDKS